MDHVTRTELRELITDLLDSRITTSEAELSAGEITTALAIDGVDVRRSAVKQACEELVADGDVRAVSKRFWRNDDWRPGTAYTRRPQPELDPDEDPFELYDRRQP